MEITHATVPVGSLTAKDRDEMYQLMERCYLGVNRFTFLRDLSEKQHAMMLRAKNGGEIVGFSTLVQFNLSIDGQPVRAIFSGDTVVDESCRRTLGFAYEVTSYFAATAQASLLPVYYVLICKGWRTYRVLPLLFREYSPALGRATNLLHKQVMDAFGAKKYPDDYQQDTGLIVFDRETQRIRPCSAEAISFVRSDPHAEFFARKNPNHLRGDELVCVAEVTFSNFSAATEKLLSQHRRLPCACEAG